MSLLKPLWWQFLFFLFCNKGKRFTKEKQICHTSTLESCCHFFSICGFLRHNFHWNHKVTKPPPHCVCKNTCRFILQSCYCLIMTTQIYLKLSSLHLAVELPPHQCSYLQLPLVCMRGSNNKKNRSVIYWKDVCCFVHCAVLRLTKSLNLKILLKKQIWWFSWSGFIHNPHCSFFQTVPWMDVCCFYTSTQYIMSLSLLSRNIKTRLGNYKNTAEAN